MPLKVVAWSASNCVKLRQIASNCVKLLLENGAKIDRENVEYETPLHIAAQSGHFDCMKYLLDNGAELHKKDQYDSTVLHFAVMGESSECINYLIDLGVDINEKDNCGHSAIQDAVAMGRLESLKCLIAKKADINEKNQYNGRSLLHFAARGAHLSCLQLLIELGADVNVRDNKSNTPLHSVGKKNCFELSSDSVMPVAEELIRAGANLSAINYHGAGPLNNCYVEALRLKKPELFQEMV